MNLVGLTYEMAGRVSVTGDWDSQILSGTVVEPGLYLTQFGHWDTGADTRIVVKVQRNNTDIGSYRYDSFWGGGMTWVIYIEFNANDVFKILIRTPTKNTDSSMNARLTRITSL